MLKISFTNAEVSDHGSIPVTSLQRSLGKTSYGCIA